LEHDYFTDILSFDISEIPGKIMGELYISLDRVKENATDLGISWVDELHRVIAHGVLHLCGLDDQDEVSKAQMRQEEEIVLALRMF
jgi:rRNA maturation RNase YbeY